MHSQEVERRLRLPAPDEPSVLPALVLPMPLPGTWAVGGRVRGGSMWSSSAFLSPRIALALVALALAVVGALVSGALRLDRLPNPFSSSVTFGARGVTLEYPKAWHVVAELKPGNDQGGWTTLIVSNLGVDGCSIDEIGTATMPVAVPSGDVYVAPGDQTGAVYAAEDRIFECIVGKPMQPGEVRLVLTRGFAQRIAVGPIEPFDATKWFGPGAGSPSFYIPTAADGWTTTVDARPAKLVVETTSIIPAADEVRTLGVYPPGGGPELWFVRATLRGPDLETLRTQVDAIARSLAFDARMPPLRRRPSRRGPGPPDRQPRPRDAQGPRQRPVRLLPEDAGRSGGNDRRSPLRLRPRWTPRCAGPRHLHNHHRADAARAVARHARHLVGCRRRLCRWDLGVGAPLRR